MSTLELRHIRCFLSVAHHLHFARAADELGIAPPSLTRQIQEAERLLGVRLFNRSKRSVSLTSAGEAYLPRARDALAHLARGEDMARAAQRGELGRVEIGYVASAAFTGLLQDWVRAFRNQRPRVDISIREVPMNQASALLVEGAIDVAFVRPPLDFAPELETQSVRADDYVLALPSDSPLVALDSVSPSQLRHETFVLPEQEYGTLEVARRGRFSPKLGGKPGTLASTLIWVSLGNLVSIVPRSLAQCVNLPGVVYREVGGKPIASEVAMVFRRHERAPAVRAFMQLRPPAR